MPKGVGEQCSSREGVSICFSSHWDTSSGLTKCKFISVAKYAVGTTEYVAVEVKVKVLHITDY